MTNNRGIARQPLSVTAGSVFAVAWAAANMVHLLNQTVGDLDVISWLNVVAALWVLGRPSSARRLAALATTQIFVTLWQLPLPPDHQVLAAVVNLAVVLAYAVHRPTSVDDLLRAFAPTARFAMLLAYSAAAVAKFNSDFLSTATSCASFMAHTASIGIFERTSTAAWIPIIGTIAAETLIPLLLLIPRTRRWGVVFAVSFHFLVSLSPAVRVGDFTVTLWALFLLFLPTGDVETVASRLVTPLRDSRLTTRLMRTPRWLLGLMVLLVIGLGALGSGAPIALSLWLFTTAAGCGLLVALVGTLRCGWHRIRPLGRPVGLQFIPIVVILGLVTSPYLGFGTSSRFTMFSGLRTEGPGTNHFFLPSLHLIDSQNNFLIIREANSESSFLARAARSDAALPVAQARVLLQNQDIGATLETQDGRRIKVIPGEGHPLRLEPRWWEAKSQHYRAFKLDGVTDDLYCSN